jgi:hypothetical protein
MSRSRDATLNRPHHEYGPGARGGVTAHRRVSVVWTIRLNSSGNRAESWQLLPENTVGAIEYFETTLTAHEAVGEDDERDSAGKILR